MKKKKKRHSCLSRGNGERDTMLDVFRNPYSRPAGSCWPWVKVDLGGWMVIIDTGCCCISEIGRGGERKQKNGSQPLISLVGCSLLHSREHLKTQPKPQHEFSLRVRYPLGLIFGIKALPCCLSLFSCAPLRWGWGTRSAWSISAVTRLA